MIVLDTSVVVVSGGPDAAQAFYDDLASGTYFVEWRPSRKP